MKPRRIEERIRSCCQSCDFVLYANPAPASASIVLREKKVLLIKRTISPYRDHWTLPAGYQEQDETPLAAAVRETKEETGLEVSAYGLYDLLYTEDDPRKRGTLAVYLCEVVGGELIAGDDASDAQFFALTDLPESVGFINNRKILDRLKREVAAGHLVFVPTEGDPAP